MVCRFNIKDLKYTGMPLCGNYVVHTNVWVKMEDLCATNVCRAIRAIRLFVAFIVFGMVLRYGIKPSGMVLNLSILY